MKSLRTLLRCQCHWCKAAKRWCQKIAACVSLLTIIPTCLAFDVQIYIPEGKLVGSFSGPLGWTGHITQNPAGVKVILWEAPDGLVVVGKLLDTQARDLSRLAQQKYATNEIKLSVLSKLGVPVTSLAEGEQDATIIEQSIYQELKKLGLEHYTTVNPSHTDKDIVAKDLYVFYDYECPYCAAAFEYFRTAGFAARVHWLPVAILGRSSAAYGAGVLDGVVPLKHIANTKVTQYPRPSAISLDAVAHNTSLLKAMQKRASTPTFVYQTPTGRVLTLKGFNPTASGALHKLLASE